MNALKRPSKPSFKDFLDEKIVSTNEYIQFFCVFNSLIDYTKMGVYSRSIILWTIGLYNLKLDFYNVALGFVFWLKEHRLSLILSFIH